MPNDPSPVARLTALVQQLRCQRTGNPVGTDTWEVSRPCACVNCRVSQELEAEVSRLTAQLTQAKREHAEFAKAVLANIESLHKSYGAEVLRLQAQIAQQEELLKKVRAQWIP